MPFIASHDGTIIQTLSLPCRASVVPVSKSVETNRVEPEEELDEDALQEWFRNELSLKKDEYEAFEKLLADSDPEHRRQGRYIDLAPKAPEIPKRASSLNFRDKYHHLVCFRPVRWTR